MAPRAPARLGLPTLVFAVVAARRAVDEHDALELSVEDNSDSALKLTNGESMICGSSQIWGLLTAGITEADDVMNIPWAKIEALKKKQLVDKGAEKTQCQTELESLLERLKSKEGRDLPRTTEEQHMQMIESGLSIFGEHGAPAFGCGRKRRLRTAEGKRVVLESRDAYFDSTKAFEKAAQTFFGKKEARLDGNAFATHCHAKLQVDKADDAEDSYCKRLCLDFRGEAQKASNEFVGAAAVGIDELKDQINQKEKCISEAKADVDACESDWTTLSVFRDELEAHSKEVSDRFAAMKDARMALYDAESQMDDILDNLEAQEKALDEAIATLAAAGGLEQTIKSALEGAKAKEKELQDKVAAASSELDGLRVELKNAEVAATHADELKLKVEVVMQMMDEFANAALREPIRMVGFDDFLDNLEFPDHLTTEAAGETTSQIAAVRSQCDNAMPSFEALKKSADIDLSPLCSFQETDVVFKDLAKQVKVRQKLIQEDLEKVMSWLTSYKIGKALTLEEFVEAGKEEEELVKKGQPANLERMKSVYAGRSSFFKYLIKWRLSGPFLKLYAKLKVLADKLAKSIDAATKNLEALQEELQAVQEAVKAATAALEKATQEVSASEAEKAKLTELVENLKAQEETMANNLDALEAALKKAMQMYRAAQDALFAAHQAATGKAFMQMEDEHVELLPEA